MFFRRKKKQVLRKPQPHFSRRISSSDEYRAMSALERQNFIRQDKTILDPKRPDERFEKFSSYIRSCMPTYEDEFYLMYMRSSQAPVRNDDDMTAAVNADRFWYNVYGAKIGPSLSACSRKCLDAEQKLNQIQSELDTQWEAEMDARHPDRHNSRYKDMYVRV